MLLSVGVDPYPYMALDMKFCAQLFLLWLATFILTRSFFNRYMERRMHLPPRPLADLPIVGHLYLLSPLVHRSLHRLSKQYGPLFNVRLGSFGLATIVSSHKMAREFLKANDLNFVSRPDLVGQEYTGMDSLGFAFAPYGPYWRFIKKLSISELLSSKKVGQSVKIRREEIRSLLSHLFEKSGRGEEADIKGALTALTNNIICRMSVSTRCSASKNDAEEIRKLVEEIVGMGGKLNYVYALGKWRFLDVFGYGKRLGIAHVRFMEIVERILKEHEMKVQRKKEMDGEDRTDDEDLMDILLKISQDGITEVKLSRNDIKAFILEILIGGTESSSLTMQWALAELINHPGVYKKAREEIEMVVGKDRLVEESDVPKLHYLQAIIKESLRLHPTVPIIPRRCIRDCNIEGFFIPRNTNAFVNIWAIGRDPNYWENPNEFRPERFLNSNISGQCMVGMKGQNFELLPFGSGRRVCPGAPLALHVIHATIAALVQCFDWPRDDPMGQSKVELKESMGFNLGLATPLHCIPITHCNPLTTQDTK